MQQKRKLEGADGWQTTEKSIAEEAEYRCGDTRSLLKSMNGDKSAVRAEKQVSGSVSVACGALVGLGGIHGLT